nr:hypothetical protein [Tanacetum cinerariifolium]
MSSDSHATITYTSMSSYEVIVNGYYRMPMDPLDPYVQLVMEAPPLPDYIPGPEAPPSPDYIPGYITELEPEMEPEEEDGDDEKSEDDFIEYPTSGGDDDADDDGDDLSDDDEDEEESSDSKEKEEEHLAPTVGESSVAAAARQIRPDLTIADRRRANDRLNGRLRRERRYFCTLSTTYAQEKQAELGMATAAMVQDQD